jgi:ribokinase
MARRTACDLVVVGGGNWDYLVRGPRLPGPGQTAEGDELHEAAGGKGANQAVAAARLGSRVALIARVGADARGDALLARLADERVDTSNVVRDPEAPTGVALILIDRAGEKQILTAPGANRRLTPRDVRAAEATISAARLVLVQLEVPLESVSEAARLAREAGLRVVLDPAPPVALPDELLGLVEVIRPNASEAEALTGVRVRSRADARRAASILLRRGVGAVAVPAGRRGNLLVWPGGERWLPHLPVESVDATGAGDAFAAALSVKLSEGASFAEAGPFASAAAALATTALGAQAGLPRRGEVEALLARTAGRRKRRTAGGR